MILLFGDMFCEMIMRQLPSEDSVKAMMSYI